MARLVKFSVRGFRSIHKLTDFEMRPLNVCIGANGAGKSNLIAFFRFVSAMMAGNLQFHLGELGGANAVLHDGAARRQHLFGSFEFATEQGVNEYEFHLSHAAPDTLIFAEERYRFSSQHAARPDWRSLDAGHRESRLVEFASEDMTCRVIRQLLRQRAVYQFHNTSSTARNRQRWDVEDAQFLREDAANLAPFLRGLRDNYPAYYRRIVETLRQVVPFFADFSLEPVGKSVLLQWHEKNSDMVFASHQVSDGTLRFMALVTLLLQPLEKMPSVLILDEPELGLHPAAINVVAGLARSASRRTQILVATQSVALLDNFEPEDVVVVDRRGRESIITRVDSERLKDWLAEYSLAELWEKNVLGGRRAS